MVKHYPTQPVVLLLDNASFHKSAASLAALSLFDHRVWIFWLPPYCSTLNPLERFWRYLKDYISADNLFPDMPQLVAAAERHLQAQNDPLNPKRFTISKFIP